ncbi:MAG: phosphodiester glycosidase family protein, partial [Lachnospiraceae bacterium]|nr:phosphodiester glycosidase family protein [Lachnospiraceae bacterium]
VRLTRKGKPVFKLPSLKDFYEDLKERGCLKVVCGKAPYTKILPVGNKFGLLSESAGGLGGVLNSSFFIMDSFDVASPYDVIGTAFGLTVKDGQVLNPPLYKREALLVKKANDTTPGEVLVATPLLKELEVEIDGCIFKDGEKGVEFFERPERSKTPKLPGKDDVLDLAVIGRKVVAVKAGGGMEIPAAGFVIRINNTENNSINKNVCGVNADSCSDNTDFGSVNTDFGSGNTDFGNVNRDFGNVNTDFDRVNTGGNYLGSPVKYRGLEDVLFAVQCGNSAVIKGEKTLRFKSPFYNIKNPLEVVYPPTLYPLNYKKARAPRMVAGAARDGSPVFLWIEGKGKFSYEKGVDSCGASLSEVADICVKLGLYNAVNLDGGGSAQIVLGGKRCLKISDRNKEDNSEAERAVPLGIRIK